MRLRQLLATGCLALAIGGFPVVSQAVVLKPCVSSSSATANPFNSQRMTARQLNAVRADAMNLRDQAAELQTFARNPQLSWQSHAEKLTYIKHDVNDMGRRMCRLENMTAASSSEQHMAVNQIQSTLPLIADNTEDAINFLNNHQNTLWLPIYKRYVDNIYHEADHVVKTIHRAQNGTLESSLQIQPSS